MAWLFLFIAGLLEVGWAIGLKYTEACVSWRPGMTRRVSGRLVSKSSTRLTVVDWVSSTPLRNRYTPSAEVPAK